MATNYPTSLDSFTDPGASTGLSVVSHSGQHTNANDAVVAIETYVGTSSSPGAMKSTYVSQGSASGAPTSGTWSTNDSYTDGVGILWNCTAGGTPGTWAASPMVFPPLGMAFDNTGAALSSGSPGFVTLTNASKTQGGVTFGSGKFTVPAGIYFATGQIGVQATTNTMGLLDCFIGHNGAVSLGGDKNAYTTPVTQYDIEKASGLVVCNANDTIELWGRADSSSTQHALVGSNSTYLHVFRVSV